MFPGKNVAVFVDGCFWHGCPVHYSVPQNNFEFWQRKLITNQERDEKVTSTLESRGWTVLRFWEHELKKSARDSMAERIGEAFRLRSGQARDAGHEDPSQAQDDRLGIAAEDGAEYSA